MLLGGYERLCFQVASALSERGHEICVLTSNFGDKHEIYQGQIVKRRLRLLADDSDIYRPFDASPATVADINRENVREFNDLTASFRPDLVFCWNMYFFDRSLLDAIVASGVPSALFLTDNWLIAALTPERIHDHFSRYVNGLEVFSPVPAISDRKLGVAAIFGSEFVLNLYHACGYSFASERVIHNGVSPPNQDPTLAPDRTATHRAGEYRLLFAGRFVDLKGPQDCVAALPLIQNSLGAGVKVRLTMVGDRRDTLFWEALRAKIEASGVADQIEILDTVSEGELVDLFNTHDVFIFPSHYEPFALTLILAMACGIPVIGSDVGGNPEILKDRYTGLLFPKGDIGSLANSAAELHRNPDLRVSIAERGRRLARKFTFSRMITQLEGALVQQTAKPTIPNAAA